MTAGQDKPLTPEEEELREWCLFLRDIPGTPEENEAIAAVIDVVGPPSSTSQEDLGEWLIRCRHTMVNLFRGRLPDEWFT